MNIFSKLWGILPGKYRKASVSLMFFMLIGMALETLGIGLIVPALAVMTQQDITLKYPSINPVIEFLGNPDRTSLVIYGMLAIISVYAFKAAFLAFLAWSQSKFVYGLQASLSQQLFTGYLKQPYTFHLQRNSAQLIRNTLTEVSMLATVNQSTLMILTEGLVLLGIASLLMIIEPVGASVVMVTLVFAGAGFYRLTSTKVKKWGEDRQFHEGLRIQQLQQGLGGVKDVKLLGREANFIQQYNIHNLATAHVAQRQTALQQFPRLWLELLAVSGVAVLVFIMIAQGDDTESVLPVLGVFAAAAFRLMPSVNRVLLAMHNLRYAVPVINTIYEEIQQFSSVENKSNGMVIRFDESIRLIDVTMRYEGADRNALEKININIRRGETVGFIGGSGAGKSTLVDIILGLLSPVEGKVEVDGIDISKGLRCWQDQIGYVPQSIFLTDDTLRRNIAFGLDDEDIDDAAVWGAIRSAQLELFISSLPEGIDTLVGERGVRLSGGQRQRIGIARALYQNPPVLVLDEATSSLDTETEEGVMQSVQALHGEKTIIIVAHRLSTVEGCDYLYQIKDGRVLDKGATSDVLASLSEQ